MPFFFNKFTPKKLPRRKLENSVVSKEFGPEFATKELGLDYPTIQLQLGETKLVFKDNEWKSSDDTVENTKEITKLKKHNKALEEENNLLKLKLEIVLDMLTQTTLESQKRSKGIEHLKAVEQF